MGVTTFVKNNNVDSALRIFKQKGIKDGDQKKLKDRYMGYKKPGEKRKEAKREAIKNSRRNNRRNNRDYN